MQEQELLSVEGIAYIIERVLDNAADAAKEAKNSPNNDFYDGKRMAYYEILDTMKNELIVREADLKELKLDFVLESLLRK